MDIAALVPLISGLGAFNGLIFGIYLLFSKIGRRAANVYLGIFLILISIRFFRSIHFYLFGLDHTVFHIGHTAFLMATPFIYFYFRASLGGQGALRKHDAIHLLILAILAIHSFYLVNIASFTLLLFYAFLSFLELKRFYNRQKKTGVHLKNYNYYWYVALVVILVVNSVLYILNIIFRFMPYIFGALSYSIIFYLMIFYWQRFQVQQKQKKMLIKYQNSQLNQNQANKYVNKLLMKIEKEKLFTDPGLDLKTLAYLLSIPYYQLSQIINQHLGKNFSEFINSYRVSEAKKLLLEPSSFNENIENIAYDAGFSNPSSFYAAFKKMTGTTPSKFRDAQKISQDL